MPENFEQSRTEHTENGISISIRQITELHDLQIQLSKKYDGDLNRKFYDGKQQLSNNLESLLAGSEQLSSEDKLDLVFKLVPLVEWSYREARFGGTDEEKEREAKDRTASESRHLALASLLNSIPDQDLDEQKLNDLLTLEDSVSRERLFEIRQRVVQAIKKMPPERAREFLPKLKSQETPAGFKRYESEWVEVLSEWSPTEAKPYINELITQIDSTKGDLGAFRVVAQAIQKWPPDEQCPIIEQVLSTHGLDGLRTDNYFELVKRWPPEKAKPLLEQLLAMPVRPRIGVTYADRDYGSLAIAMSNWPAEEINSFLSDENNTRWVRDVAQVKCHERSTFQKSYEANYNEYLSKFRMHLIAHRDLELTTEMIDWMIEGFNSVSLEDDITYIGSIIKKNKQIFSPRLASEMFKRSSIANIAVDLWKELETEKQLQFKSAVADLLMFDDSFNYTNLLPQAFEEIAKWPANEVDDLVLELLSRQHDRSYNLINAFRLLQGRNIIANVDVIRGIFRISIGRPNSYAGRAADELTGKIERNDQTTLIIVEAAGDAIAQKFSSLDQHSARDLLKIASKYNMELSTFIDKLPIYVQSFAKSFGIADTTNLCQFVKKNFEYVSFLSVNPNEHSKIMPEDISILSALRLSLLEAEKVIRAGINLPEVKTEEDFKNLFETLVEADQNWQDEQSISNPFRVGAEIFGHKRMFEYLRRDGLSLHDNLHAFEEIAALYKVSGLGANEFYGQVLQQVRMDDREYPEGVAHHHLNAIAQTTNKNVAEVIARVQKYREIERLQELAATFNTPQAVFASWLNLKRYSELEQLLGQTEVFDELKELKAEGKERLYRYVETLAFHPDSKVNMGAVIQFWRDPESFLSAGASHTPSDIHDRKKPSNYLYMPNLDLTASELRDTLVEGKMDGLSAFTPLEIRYTIPLEDVKTEPLPELINKALGSSKKGIEGAARNSRKLFSELGKLLKPHGISVVEYIQGKSLPEGVSLSLEIEALLYNRDFGMERPLVKTREFVARISQKSDPEGAIAGDDTVNCMPFGDGKNTVYTFNPNTAQFVIRVVKGDGKERTIAQSVLTKDMDIKTLVPDVISKLQQEGGHLEDILPADILATAPVYAACDNVEVAPNYSDERHKQIIEAIFRDFFKEYMGRYAKTEGLNPKKVPIGQGYLDALSQLPTETNTFAPQAPVSYSDKTGGNVCMLDLESSAKMDLIWQKQVRETKVERPTEPPLPKMKGLGYLTFEDTLKVAYLEGKAYSDNQSLMQFLFNMENGLIAKDINNAAKDRPNMSLKYADEAGRMRGYMLAWEGRLSDENVEYNAEEFFNQPCVYIIDIATDRENRMAGGRLIQGFAELYKQNYLDKGNPMPIFAQAREATSYQIVKRQLDKLGKDAGFNFELIELPTYEVGEDVMHPIIIRPVSKKK